MGIRYSTAEKALKLLEIDGAVGREYDRGNKYFRTLNPWQPDIERIQNVTNLRRQELQQKQAYMRYDGCLMEFLCRELDDHDVTPCGKCANCAGRGFSTEVSRDLAQEAVEFLRSQHLLINPRKIWPSGIAPSGKRRIDADHLIEQGRALCIYGDSGWGKMIRNGKYVDGHFSDELVKAGADFIQNRWGPDPTPAWVTAIPSHRHPRLVYDYAQRLAGQLDIPFHAVLSWRGEQPEQKTMENSSMQARNVQKSLAISGNVKPGPVLLVDDIVDSRWTLTVAGFLLRTHGSGPVFPFTLA